MEGAEGPGAFSPASRFVDMLRVQGLIKHLRLPKAVKDDPMSFLESEPSGSSKANVTEDICPSLKAAGFLTHEGSCRMVRDAYAGFWAANSACRAEGEWGEWEDSFLE